MDPDKFDPGVPLLAIKITQFVPCWGFVEFFKGLAALLAFISKTKVVESTDQPFQIKALPGGFNDFCFFLLARFMGKSSNLTNLNSI